jgi:hypothetical protein
MDEFSQDKPYQGMQQPLPNATAVLVLGIISIVGCFCYGIPGIICGIIALILAAKSKALYFANPGMYTPGSYNNLAAGRVCAIIGLILCVICLALTIVMLSMFGTKAFLDPNFLESLREAQER